MTSDTAAQPFEPLQGVMDRAFGQWATARAKHSAKLTLGEVGAIASVSTGIAMVHGLPGVGYDELLEFTGGIYGIAFNVDETEIGVVLLGDYAGLCAGDEVRRTGRVMDVGVGEGVLGRVVDPLGVRWTARVRWR
jgi:F-type H+-transporting ATPase subunit alpha